MEVRITKTVTIGGKSITKEITSEAEEHQLFTPSFVNGMWAALESGAKRYVNPECLAAEEAFSVAHPEIPRDKITCIPGLNGEARGICVAE